MLWNKHCISQEKDIKAVQAFLVSFEGPEQQNWALAAVPSQTPLMLLLELPRNSITPKFPDTSPAALVFESNLLHKAALSCSAELFQGLCLGFDSGSYFVMMESQSGACDPEEFEEGLEVMTDKLGEGRMYYARWGASYIRMEPCNANINKVSRTAKENSLLLY